MAIEWYNPTGVKSRPYKCGYCGNLVASSVGYFANDGRHFICLCPHCHEPTYFDGDKQIPGVSFGEEVAHLPQDVHAIYREARNCAAASCYTAAVLTLRKLLMNIAVAQGAAAGEPFVAYVEFLAAKGFVPPNGRAWVDHIRKKGNEATHEIVLMSKADAEELISFAEMLLKFIYEFPNRVPKTP